MRASSGPAVAAIANTFSPTLGRPVHDLSLAPERIKEAIPAGPEQLVLHPASSSQQSGADKGELII